MHPSHWNLRIRTRLLSSRSLALLALIPAFGLEGCGADTVDTSTETGNPPLVASDKVQVADAGDGEVRVTGSAGAVDPGGAAVTVTAEESGDSVTVDSEMDGSFSATIEGSVDDSYEVEVASGGQTDVATVQVNTTDEASTEQRACEKICSGPTECGAAETLFPIANCDCDGAVCECSQEECVSACLSDMDGYRQRGSACSTSIADVQACILDAPCEALANQDADAVLAFPSCEAAIQFADVCGFEPAGSCSTGTATSSGSVGSNQVEDCETGISCGGVDYGVECRLSEGAGPAYTCTCSTNGAPQRTFRSDGACGFPGEDEIHSLRYFEFYCGFNLPGSPPPSGCGDIDYSEGQDGSPGACSVAASCGDGDYALECNPTATGDGVSCDCIVDGRVVSQVPLDARGCSVAAAYSEEEPDPLAIMNALCGF